jgi:mRNA-degrading endonuclease RelE of RelBE toxin-antitoxin system
VKPVYGEPDAYRVRHGDWRGLDRVDREQRAVTVYLIDNRKDVYR